MNFRTALKGAGRMFLILCAVVTAPAATINANYEFNGTGSGDPTHPPVIGNGTGTLTPLGNMTWVGMNFPDVTTGANRGMFTMTFSNGDTLVGTLQEQLDLAAAPNADFTQVLTVTGGTGALQSYNGTLTGGGFLNLANSTFSTSGAGTLNTAPEPDSLALLPAGLLCFFAYRRWAVRK
jgi:hypothetical protein